MWYGRSAARLEPGDAGAKTGGTACFGDEGLQAHAATGLLSAPASRPRAEIIFSLIMCGVSLMRPPNSYQTIILIYSNLNAVPASVKEFLAVEDRLKGPFSHRRPGCRGQRRVFRCLTPAPSSTIIGWSDYSNGEGFPMLQGLHFGTKVGIKTPSLIRSLLNAHA